MILTLLLYPVPKTPSLVFYGAGGVSWIDDQQPLFRSAGSELVVTMRDAGATRSYARLALAYPSAVGRLAQ
jgi:hypothetical protein